MTDAITAAIVDLARLALYAYAVQAGRIVILHWLDVTPKVTPEQIVDAARTQGIDLAQPKGRAA